MVMGIFTVAIVLLNIIELSNGAITSGYQRKSEPSMDLPLESFPPPPGHSAPEQVHITQGDHEGRGVIISWVTPKKHPGVVTYWEAGHEQKKHKTSSKTTHYKFYNYTSGYIHHTLIKGLKHDTKYYYEVGQHEVARRFHFTTPPPVGPDVPYTFGVIGDLGQTADSNQTLEHYVSNPQGQAMLFIGDLSYADDHPFHDNRRWDTWGRFVEKSAAYQAWIWTPGNHELDFAPELGESVPWKPFLHRYSVPYKESKSTSPLWYSIKRASAYIIVLNSYSAYGKYTPQYSWLEQELPKINRKQTPWVIVLLHSPWYNSNNYHYMEGESMRVMFEPWFVEHKVDIVFAGHVHSYERSERVSNIKYNITDGLSAPIRDSSAPVYITIGDGGNVEGIANK
ncbi:OLC1v1015507C2 [Oldenlandia corymbosa var. corymbosa]|uniref:Purple acid phosphatase n=1 Tax=Oldenlandia corymbosa var. corymbosa TaxID=529605 RepID=A0AAV1E5M8_OLDCO|nr:OLC1v1015507C2 [Oldenlandia corymbosa var. corymbosa]